MSKETEHIDIPNKLYFRIGEVADIVGVDSHVLRYWEKEMGMSPHRSNSGQRLYRKVDIVYFLKIKHLIHTEGYTIGGAKQALLANDHNAIHTTQLNDLQSKLTDIQSQLTALRQKLRS